MFFPVFIYYVEVGVWGGWWVYTGGQIREGALTGTAFGNTHLFSPFNSLFLPLTCIDFYLVCFSKPYWSAFARQPPNLMCYLGPCHQILIQCHFDPHLPFCLEDWEDLPEALSAPI